MAQFKKLDPEQTNIRPEMQRAFQALVSGEYVNFALFSCFVDGKPTAAICSVVQDGEEYTITPLFIWPAEGMVLTDHDGNLA